MKKVFAINFGSTSTKMAYYENDRCVFKDTVAHSAESLKGLSKMTDQIDLRKRTVLDYMDSRGIVFDDLDAFVSRGAQTEPIDGGVYRINQAMIDQALSGEYGTHIASLGCVIALEMTSGTDVVPLTCNTPCTDEFEPIARFSGLKEISRKSSFQALNHKAMAEHYAESIAAEYEDLNLIVVMLGGGISVVAHQKGRMIDGPDALEGEGPFSNNRCCTVPIGPLIRLCYSGEYDLDAMMHHVNGEAGLMSYLGTMDIRALCDRIDEGDEYAREVMDAMCYQTAKEVGAMATVLRGDIDAILLIGGMANAPFIVNSITERVDFLAPVVVMPGEREMEALCLNAYEALVGKQKIKEFVPGKSL